MTEISITTTPTELVLTDEGGTELVIEVSGGVEIVLASFGPQGPAGPPGSGGPGGAVAWADVTGKPSTFPPEAHGHAYASPAQGDLADSAVQPEDLKTINGVSLLGGGDVAITGANPLLGWFL